PRTAVRLLHARDDHGRGGAAGREPESDRGRGQARARGQPVPLHGLSQHRQGGARCRQGQGTIGLRAAGGDGMNEEIGEGGVASEITEIGAEAGEERKAPSPSNHVGQAIRRKEDPRLITGRGRYVDDITLPGTLWAALVRSPEAHAKIVAIDASAARERSGIHAVFTGEDMPDLGGPLPMAWVPPGVEVNNPEHWPLARGTVNHVGDPVAVVLGEDRYAVVDAAEDVVVEYEPLEVVTDPEKALEGPPFVHEELGTNKVHEWSLPGGDVEAGFAEADAIVERRVVNHRIAGAPIEPRGV